MSRLILLLLFIARASYGTDVLVEAMVTGTVPVQYAVCAYSNVIKLVRQEPAEKVMPCPSGWNVLGYLILRQVSEGLVKKFGTVTSREVILEASDKKANTGRVIVINLLDENERALRSYPYLKEAEIVTPVSEEDLNLKLEKFAPESFDLLVINTHGSAILSNGKERLVDIPKIKKFNLLTNEGRIVHLGCNALDIISEERTLEFSEKFSTHAIPVFGSEASVKEIGMTSIYTRFLLEFLVKPYANILNVLYHQAEERGAKRVRSIKLNCREMLL